MPGENRLDLLRARARRVQLVVGLGFLGFVLGSLLSALLVQALASPIRAIPWMWLRAGLSTLVGQLWALLFVPLFSFVLGRVLDVSHWRIPAGIAATGLFFLVCLTYVSQGSEGFSGTHPSVWVTRLGTVGLGILLGKHALVRGRGRAAVAARRAQELAATNAAEYAAFRAASEELASRHDAPKPPSTPDAT